VTVPFTETTFAASYSAAEWCAKTGRPAINKPADKTKMMSRFLFTTIPPNLTGFPASKALRETKFRQRISVNLKSMLKLAQLPTHGKPGLEAIPANNFNYSCNFLSLSVSSVPSVNSVLKPFLTQERRARVALITATAHQIGATRTRLVLRSASLHNSA
jgi:hypothetical protein